MLSVHDNHLYKYEFDARTSRLVLRTRFLQSTPEEFTDVWFHEVWTHHIESVLGHDIIFDIEESEVSHELQSYGDLFARLERHGWPPLERGDSLPSVIERQGLRIWNLHSSYGVSGFVVAKRMELVAAAEAPCLTIDEKPYSYASQIRLS